ncbi:MAG: T9SS type A sorting domain-containing protein [Candidatus Latescibacterota bacterium]
MRRIILFLLLYGALWCGNTAFSASFAPQTLRINGPNIMQYHFDGREASVPFTLSGAPADVTIFIFTRDHAETISKVRNGNLGWHYVDRIDTCLFVSPSKSVLPGNNTISWNGRNEDGSIAISNDYTFYLWAYDAVSPGVKATNFILPRRFTGAHIQTRDKDGQPMGNPVIFDGLPSSFISEAPVRVVRNRWTLGGNPSDASLLETTAYTTASDACRMALDPADPFRYFFTQSVRPGEVLLRTWEWVPNADASPRAAWGKNGEAVYPGPSKPYQPYLPPFGGPVSDDTDRIFFPYLWPAGEEYRIPNVDNGVAVVNTGDGSLRRLDLDGWSSPPDAMYCPGFVEYCDGLLWVSSPASCLVQMIDPIAGDESRMVRWENGYGDGVWDKALRPDGYQKTWACFGSVTPPYPGNIALDGNRFGLFPATGLGAASLGLLAPDGSGVGYFPIPGLSDGAVYGLKVVDTGSPFDGLFYSGESAGDSAGVWFRGQDVFKGKIVVGLDPEGPDIFITSPKQGDILRVGTQITISWQPYRGYTTDAPLRIEFSYDNGATWFTVADSVGVRGEHSWIVPKTPSSECIIRILSIRSPQYPYYTVDRLTIAGPVSVSDESIPHPFVTVSNRPNPFNPSTVIRYELGLPRQVIFTVYNALGQQVHRLDLGHKDRGTHEYRFDGSGLTSGLYFYRVETEQAGATGKMLLVR